MVCLFVCSFLFSAVYEPRVIRGQFIYEKFIMLKMFLSALAVASLSLALLSVLAKTSFDRAYTAYVGCLMKKGVVGTLIGGFLLGAGMTVSGAVSTIKSDYSIWVIIYHRTLCGENKGKLRWAASNRILKTETRLTLFYRFAIYFV